MLCACAQLCESIIDVEVSGSTGIISFLRGNKLFVANVGDSRAVLGRVTDNGLIRAVDLSHDQKPDRCVASLLLPRSPWACWLTTRVRLPLVSAQPR